MIVMKYAVSLVIGVCMMLLSCDKAADDFAPAELEGSWKMIEVTDLASNVVERKPASIRGDVILRFMPSNRLGGRISGNTPTNVFGPDEYLLSSENSLTIQGITMTKVAESSWGNLFIENIRNTSEVRIEYGNLLIQTPAKLLRF